MSFLGKGCYPLLRVFPIQEAKQDFLKKASLPHPQLSYLINMTLSTRLLGYLCRAEGEGTSCQSHPFPCRFLPLSLKANPACNGLCFPRNHVGNWELNQTLQQNLQAESFSIIWAPVVSLQELSGQSHQ